MPLCDTYAPAHTHTHSHTHTKLYKEPTQEASVKAHIKRSGRQDWSPSTSAALPAAVLAVLVSVTTGKWNERRQSCAAHPHACLLYTCRFVWLFGCLGVWMLVQSTCCSLKYYAGRNWFQCCQMRQLPIHLLKCQFCALEQWQALTRFRWNWARKIISIKDMESSFVETQEK